MTEINDTSHHSGPTDMDIRLEGINIKLENKEDIRHILIQVLTILSVPSKNLLYKLNFEGDSLELILNMVPAQTFVEITEEINKIKGLASVQMLRKLKA